ncbi:MAG: helix-turn-helix domain-containing protein [Bacteroidaceae bacterium]|nr:helix-turn-helix domain-containing protein [Bacteroidaceae bacterium]
MKELEEKLDRIERYNLLAAKRALLIDDVALLTGWSKCYIYKLTCTHEIPHYKPNGKTIYFDKEEIEEYLLKGRVATKLEVAMAAAKRKKQ